MKKFYLFSIALRHLTGQKRQTLLTMGGVAVGVMVLLIISSLMNGLVVSFTETIVDAAPHLVVTAEKAEDEKEHNIVQKLFGDSVVFLTDRGTPDSKNIIKAYYSFIDKINSLKLFDSVSPFVVTQVVANSSSETNPLFVTGVIPEVENRIINLRKRIREGSFDNFRSSSSGILLGKQAAQDLNISVGERLRLISSKGQLELVRVSGIFVTGVKNLDATGYIHLKLAQKLEKIDSGSISGINIKTFDPTEADKYKPILQALTGFKVETWKQTNGSIITLFKIISTISRFLVFFTIIVAGFGVTNILVTVILGKSKDISLLRSIGFTRARIVLLFLFEGSMIGFAGSVIGCILGLFSTTLIGFIPTGGSDFSARKTFYLDQDPNTYLFTALFAMLVCLIASVGPAFKAAGLKPVDVLRGEG